MGGMSSCGRAYVGGYRRQWPRNRATLVVGAGLRVKRCIIAFNVTLRVLRLYVDCKRRPLTCLYRAIVTTAALGLQPIQTGGFSVRINAKSATIESIHSPAFIAETSRTQKIMCFHKLMVDRMERLLYLVAIVISAWAHSAHFRSTSVFVT